MAITYYMLHLPPAVFFLLIVSIFALLSGLGTVLFRKLVKIKVQRAHNEVTGFLFLAIASFYALLLSFVVLVVWDRLSETEGIVSREGSAAVALYRDINGYPDSTDIAPLKRSYLNFCYNVIDVEFPNMQLMLYERKTPESFDLVFSQMAHLHPDSETEHILLAQMLSQLNTLTEYRGQRLSTMETEIAPAMWLPMLLGAFITILCALLLDIEHKTMHILLNSLLGCFIGIFFFTIIYLDHPYAGSHGLKPTRYMQIFTSEGWAEELEPTAPTPILPPHDVHQ